MDLLFITHLFNGLLMVGLAAGLGWFLTRRFHLGWRLWGIGAATFVLSQVGHIPFNWIFTRLFAIGTLPSPPPEWQLTFNAIFLGMSAGLWEELARAGVYRWWADDARSWRKGTLLGAGHGGIEAIITGVLVLYAFVQMVAMRGADIARFVAPAQLDLAKQQVAAYWSAAWWFPLLGPTERLFAMTNHIALSLLVMQAFTRKQPAWIAVAVIWHAFLDGSMIYLSGLWRQFSWGTLAIEGLIGVGALFSLGIIFALRRPEPTPEPEEVQKAGEPGSPARISDLIQEKGETEEDLEKSRYA